MKYRILNILDKSIGGYLEQNVFEIDNNLNFFDIGLDSLGFVNLIVALEREFNMTICQEDLKLENFSSINRIILFLEDK